MIENNNVFTITNENIPMFIVVAILNKVKLLISISFIVNARINEYMQFIIEVNTVNLFSKISLLKLS